MDSLTSSFSWELERGDWILWDAVGGFISWHDNGLQMKDVNLFVQFYPYFNDSVPNYKSVDKHQQFAQKIKKERLVDITKTEMGAYGVNTDPLITACFLSPNF